MEKYQINLLQPELLPKTPPLTLSRVLLIWGAVLTLMLIAFSLVQTELHSVTQQHSQLTATANQQNTLMANLQQQVIRHKQDSRLTAQLDKLKTILKYKQALQQQLTNQSSAYVRGYSSAMTELAKYHRPDISLQQVMINDTQMTYIGVAKTPDAVPEWLAGFKQSSLLSGMSFSHFKLAENKQQLTDFVVSTVLPVGAH